MAVRRRANQYAVGDARRARRRREGVTVVSIDTNGKVAAELFVRQACLAQTANPLPAASKGAALTWRIKRVRIDQMRLFSAAH